MDNVKEWTSLLMLELLLTASRKKRLWKRIWIIPDVLPPLPPHNPISQGTELSTLSAWKRLRDSWHGTDWLEFHTTGISRLNLSQTWTQHCTLPSSLDGKLGETSIVTLIWTKSMSDPECLWLQMWKIQKQLKTGEWGKISLLLWQNFCITISKGLNEHIR